MSSLSKLKQFDGEEREFVLRGGNPLVAWPLARRRIAEEIRLRRALMRDTIAKIKSESPDWEPGDAMLQWVRDHCREPLHSGYNRPKPTRENVWEAMRNLAYAARRTEGRMGENDTEYYSACGHDDYLGEVAHWYRMEAIACGRAWCALAKKNDSN